MDALKKFGSMGRVSAAAAAAGTASAQASETPAESAGTAPLNNKEDVGDLVSNGVSAYVDEPSNGEVLLDAEEEEEAEDEEVAKRLTPIRAPVSRDDDDDVGDGDVSTGSGESFDSALERMAASSTASYEASPVGSYNGPSHLYNMQQQEEEEEEEKEQRQQQQKGLGVGQQGALMRLNQMISGESTLDTAVIDDCTTKEEFKQKMKEIARSKELSPEDASISSIMDALLPLVHERGGHAASESKGEYDDERNVLEEDDGEDVDNHENFIISDNEEDKEEDKEADVDASAAAMPVAKLSAEDEEELIEGDQVLDEKGERSNGDEFEEANEEADEEEDEATLVHNTKGNVEGTLSGIIARELRDDETEEVATVPARSEEKKLEFPSDAVLPEESGSVRIAHEEPALQEGARERKEDGGDIEDNNEVLLVPQEEREECKETESKADAIAEKESAAGGQSEEETSPFAQAKGEEDAAAAPIGSTNCEAVEVEKDGPKPSPVLEDESESGIGEDDSTPTLPVNAEQAKTMGEKEASEEADGLRSVDYRAASESAALSEPPRGKVNTEEEESSLSAVPKQVSRDVINSVRDKDEFENQTPELSVAAEDFTTTEDRADRGTAVPLTAENDNTLDASDVDLSLLDTVKSVNPVTENSAAETAVEADPKSAILSELQNPNGDWDGEEDDEEEVNDDEDGEDEDEDKAEEEHGNLDAAEALAALVKSARSESESRSENSKPPSLGAAGPSLPQRPTGRSRPATVLEPVRNPARSNVATASQLAAAPEDNPSNGDGNDGNDETREKLQNIRVKFLRLAHRLGQSPQNVVVAQVLYRLGLAEQLRGGRSASRAGAFSFDRANAIAEEQEASGQEEELDFACTVLLLGKTGVGKSATINSIFDEPRTSTNAFHPSTKKVQEIVGHVHGIKVRVIDTPGLLPSVMDQQHNERIMGSVKNYIRKSSPDIVLYFDRLDMQSRDYGDLPLLRNITDTFGAAIWFNAIVVLTHASTAPPDGPNGVPLSYEMFVAQRSHVVQQTIRQAAGDMRLMNPVSLVENHPACRTNRAGQRVLPNGQIWKPQLLLLCFASKILADANSLLKLQDTSSPGRPFGQRSRVPPLPFLLSSLLQSRAQLKVPDEQMGDEDDADSDDESDDSDGDDYNELPPFRPLTKEELEELSKEQKQQYAEELADRERLFQKKQWREELKRRKEMKQRAAAMSKEELAHAAEEGADDDGGRAAAVPVPMPDMALPPSFDSDNPTHRYRYLETASQWLVRPVLETHGWDHDAGYDGFNVEKLFVVADKIPASISGQVTKDKKEGQVNFEAAASFKHGEGKSTLAGFEIQTIGKDLGYTLRSETQFNNFKRNKTTAGLTFTLLGDTVAAGVKLEDRLLVGKRFKVVVNGGVLTGRGDKAFGGSLEATLRGKEYPLSRTLSTLGLSVMDWHGDLAVGGNLQSQFMVGQTMMVARANLNNRGAGQVSIRASSSEQLQMALIGIVPILRSLINSWLGAAQPSQ